MAVQINKQARIVNTTILLLIKLLSFMIVIKNEPVSLNLQYIKKSSYVTIEQ